MTSHLVSAESGAAGQEKQIGDIIRQTHNLSAEQVEAVLKHQRQTGLKFGEAAVVLGYIKREQVLWALSQQFLYSYTTDKDPLPEVAVASHPFSEHAESFRDLRSQLIGGVLAPGQPNRAITVVSTDSGDGKTYFSVNLAVAFSQLGARTLLLDADMRTPRVHEIFNIGGGTGLSSVLAGRSQPNLVRPLEALPNLYVLPVGVAPPNPLELVQKTAFARLLQELYEKFEYIVIDTPAATHGADARVIAAACGASLLVAKRNRSRLAPMKALIASLQKMKVQIAGVVINEHSG